MVFVVVLILVVFVVSFASFASIQMRLVFQFLVWASFSLKQEKEELNDYLTWKWNCMMKLMRSNKKKRSWKWREYYWYSEWDCL